MPPSRVRIPPSPLVAQGSESRECGFPNRERPLKGPPAAQEVTQGSGKPRVRLPEPRKTPQRGRYPVDEQRVGRFACRDGNLCGRSERWQSGRMRRSRKPLGVVRLLEGSNPSLSAHAGTAPSTGLQQFEVTERQRPGVEVRWIRTESACEWIHDQKVTARHADKSGLQRRTPLD